MSDEATQLQYRKDGYVMLPGFLDQAGVDALARAADAMQGGAGVGPVVAANPRLDFDDGSELLIKMIEPVVDVSDVIASVASGPAVQRLFRSIFAPLVHRSDSGDAPAAAAAATANANASATDPAPVLFEDKVHYKMPTDPTVPQRSNGAGAFPFHQDHAFWSTYSTSLATLLIYVDPPTELNGCLHLVPYPPSDGPLPHLRTRGEGASRFPLEIDPATMPTLGPAVSTAGLGAGGAVLFSCMTPHMSLPNIDSHPRRTLFLSFNPAADGDGYNVVSGTPPLYAVGSHNRGVVPRHKVDAWHKWMDGGSSTSATGGKQLIWGDAVSQPGTDATAAVASAATAATTAAPAAAAAPASTEHLTEQQRWVTQDKGTEAAFSGEYCDRFDPGTYSCVVCGSQVFDSDSKFETSCGWPAFSLGSSAVKVAADETDYSKLPGHNHSDAFLALPQEQRVEASCNDCGAHLGHVMADAGSKTGKRFCINSASTFFEAASIKRLRHDD